MAGRFPGAPTLELFWENLATGRESIRTFTEAELRWQFDKRWSVVGFGGVGCAWADDSPFFSSHVTVTGGGGGAPCCSAAAEGVAAR